MEIWNISSRPSTRWEKVMAGIKDLLKKEQSQIADDEYYAGLQSLFERDPITAKEMNVSDITYPFMEKSGDYNYRGEYAREEEIQRLKNSLEIRKMSYLMSPESSFHEKLEKGEKPIMIYQEPISTGEEPEDLNKISTIMHESRHKVFDKPKYKNFMKDRNLDEETFVRFLGKKFFPENDLALIEGGADFADPEKSMKKYNDAVEEFVLEFGEKEQGLFDKIKNMFAGGGRVDKAFPGRSRDI